MVASSPAERRALSRIAANTRWENESDWSAATAAARANGPASLDYWIRKIEAEGTHTDADADTLRAVAAKRRTNFYERLARKGRQARAANAAKAAAARRR